MDAATLVMGSSGILAALAAWGMAAFVYAAGPSRQQNRLVAVFLALVGFQMGTAFGLRHFLPTFARPLESVAVAAHISQSLVYLALLGTLDSPLSRAFRGGVARRALLSAAALSVAAWPIYGGTMMGASGVGFAYYPALLFHGLVLLFGFFVALSAWRRAAPGSAARARGRAFAFAFGIRDLVFCAFILIAVAANMMLGPGPRDPGSLVFVWKLAERTLVPISVVAMVLLMGYGMARAHLFDVDLTVRAGVRRGAIAGAFVATFFVVSQFVEGFTSDAFGLAGGALASGLLLFALAPLQRAAERISASVVPDARRLAERSADERAELYREQVRIAWEDGAMGLKERRMLDVARERLGLAPDAALALEGEVVRAARAV